MTWGTRVAQSVKHPTLDFSSSHDLMVWQFEPYVGLCADSMEPACDLLSASPCSLMHSLCVSNKIIAVFSKGGSWGTWLAQSVEHGDS